MISSSRITARPLSPTARTWSCSPRPTRFTAISRKPAGFAAAGVATPNADTVWTATGSALTDKTPLTLTWNNGAGLTFTRTISVDADYMFKIEDAVKNDGTAAVQLAPYSRVARFGLPPSPSQTYVLHEGPMGVFDGTLNEEEAIPPSRAMRKIDAEGNQIGL
jgi:YidC/Oxa1 family membrane protein insertase